MKNVTCFHRSILSCKKRSLAAALLLAGTGHVGLAQAAAVNSGDILTINSYTTDANNYVTGGSWFAFDLNGNGNIAISEKTGLSQGTTGLEIGTTTSVGAYHVGAPVPGDTNVIDAPFSLSLSTGSHHLTAAVMGNTTTGLGLGGWTMAWSSSSAIPLGSGAWTPTNCAADIAGCGAHSFSNGTAQFIWDGVYGHAYTLNYGATVPAGDPSGLGGFQYFLHLEGTVQAVPVPAAAWLFGSGLFGLAGLLRRKRSSH